MDKKKKLPKLYNLPKLRLCLVHEKQPVESSYAMRSTEDAEELFEPLKNDSEERFISVHLNAMQEVLGMHEVSHGTLSSSLVHPREVFKAAILANSHAILVCHNHPSGSNLFASKQDIDTTNMLLQAGKILGIDVLDHVIVSPVHEMFSVRQHYPDMWKPS